MTKWEGIRWGENLGALKIGFLQDSIAPDLSRSVDLPPHCISNGWKSTTLWALPPTRMAQIRREHILGEKHPRRAEIFAPPDGIFDLSFVICHLSFYSPVAQLAPPFAPSFWILGTVDTTRGQPNVASNRKRFGLSIWPYVSRVVSKKAGSALFLPARAMFLSR